jgi:hypothetical protein
VTASAAGATRADTRPPAGAAALGGNSAPPPAGRALALAAAAALALHAALLGVWPEGPAADATTQRLRADTAAPMSARQIVMAPPPALQAAAPPPRPAPAAPAAALAAPAPDSDPQADRRDSRVPAATASATVAAEAPAEPAAAAASSAAQPEPPSASPSVPAAAAAAASATVTASADATPAAASDSAATPPPPVYRTQPAPPATLLFELKRGLAGGQAVLQWRPDSSGARYALTLQAQAFGISVAGWNSSGRFDAAGLAPERYAELRRGREVRATNFQRAAQKISFSGQSSEFELTPGVQDRSS